MLGIMEKVGDWLTPKESLAKEELARLGRVPKHIAIIMDGNRRWAKKRGLPISYGHWKGAELILDLIEVASSIGVQVMTLYSFSTENWRRSPSEVEELMKLIVFYLKKNTPLMVEKSVRLETIGDISRFPVFVQEQLLESQKQTVQGTKIRLVLALNYGARDEMKRAIMRIAGDLEVGKLQKADISETVVSGYLDTAAWVDPELLIRTSGEQRLSNFLLWQLSYAEVYVTKVLWPDFTTEDLLDAVLEFQRRDRRLGE